MAERARIEKIIRAAYAARAAKDLDAITRIFTPNGTFRLAGAPATFAGARTLTGEAELRSGLGDLIDERGYATYSSILKSETKTAGATDRKPSGVPTPTTRIWTISNVSFLVRTVASSPPRRNASVAMPQASPSRAPAFMAPAVSSLS